MIVVMSEASVQRFSAAVYLSSARRKPVTQLGMHLISATVSDWCDFGTQALAVTSGGHHAVSCLDPVSVTVRVYPWIEIVNRSVNKQWRLLDNILSTSLKTAMAETNIPTINNAIHSIKCFETQDTDEKLRLTCGVRQRIATDHVRVPSPMIGQYKLYLR